MTTKSKKVDVNLRLNSMNELRFSSNLDEIDSLADTETGLGFNIFANKEDRSLTLSIGIALRFQQKILLECWYSFGFNILEFDEVVELNGERVLCKGELLPSLLGISFSTLRGILYTRTLGTKISPFILPVINPQEIISKYKSDMKE